MISPNINSAIFGSHYSRIYCLHCIKYNYFAVWMTVASVEIQESMKIPGLIKVKIIVNVVIIIIQELGVPH